MQKKSCASKNISAIHKKNNACSAWADFPLSQISIYKWHSISTFTKKKITMINIIISSSNYAFFNK